MLRTTLFTFAALVCLSLLTFSALNTSTKISPQGCRMSYMSPSYVVQTGLNASWTTASLAGRYRLMLYREVGWDSNNEKLRGVPVLFIPGNAGSAHQVRSIASSASRQYYSSPSHINPYFASRGIKPLDIFAVDFNEDLSAFHGPTLESERQYTAAAIDYILSLYPSGTQIIVTGHSMGGIVAVSLLPSPHISTVITMSTPHGAPPARFDARMDRIFADAHVHIARDPTPILSVCGGVTDTMIPSEFCALPPQVDADVNVGFRKTVFSSALEGCWSGVGHREMVWCHQVRWRVAKAMLELGGAETETDKAYILNKWFRDGIDLPSFDANDAEVGLYNFQDALEITHEDSPLVISDPRETRLYKFPILAGDQALYPRDFVLYLSEGTISPVAPASPLSLEVSVFFCRNKPDLSSSSPDSRPVCESLRPSSLRLIPNPVPGKPFPVPSEGVDESDGVVAFTALLPPSGDKSGEEWISVKVESKTEKGWVVASLEESRDYTGDASAFAPLFSKIRVQTDPKALLSVIRFPNLLSNVLLIYRAVPKLSQTCKGSHLPPLLLHTSGPSEAHYHRLENNHPVLLHGHSSAPFLPISSHLLELYSKGLNLTIYSSGECGLEGLSITVDWWNSFGRWGSRYWNAILAWSAGLIAFLFYSSWATWDSGAPMSTPFQSLRYLCQLLPRAMILFFIISLLPLPSWLWLGNSGEPIFAPIAPLILLLSSGLVILSWNLLVLCSATYGRLVSIISRVEADNIKESSITYRRGFLMIALMSFLVSVLIPWQVAFLACYLIHLHHCSILPYVKISSLEQQDSRNQKFLILLMMTWCLPVVAPALAVWVRTLMTAGFTTPFDGDHFVLNVLSFMVLTYVMATSREPIFIRRHRLEFIPVPYLYACGALVVFFVGPRSTYRMYEVLNWPTFMLLCFRVGPKPFSVPTPGSPAEPRT
ncbi:PGAP1-domain-containing protein [Phellopilus nigrolimitatus]|nr:PGAP1-domain-containing protein [Phellopilus nigrolimitatus]